MSRSGEQPHILDLSQLADEFRQQVSTQDYSSKPCLEGVQLIDLPFFSDEGGDFCELARFLESGALALLPNYRPAQLSYSLVLPGTIKAWHLHFSQDDLWFVPPTDRLLVGLLDLRAASATCRQTMRFILGAGRARVLYIPRGVAHGMANVTTQPASVIYFTDRAFDADHPDERRLPFDIIGADFWQRHAE
jgi:dTDP-4-dehydrorhamnose 3,5-epimerase